MTLTEILGALGAVAGAASVVGVAWIRARSRRHDAHDQLHASREDRVERLEQSIDGARRELAALVALRLDDREQCEEMVRRSIASAEAACDERLRAAEARQDAMLSQLVTTLRRAHLEDTGVHHVEEALREGRARRSTPPEFAPSTAEPTE